MEKSWVANQDSITSIQNSLGQNNSLVETQKSLQCPIRLKVDFYQICN